MSSTLPKVWRNYTEKCTLDVASPKSHTFWGLYIIFRVVLKTFRNRMCQVFLTTVWWRWYYWPKEGTYRLLPSPVVTGAWYSSQWQMLTLDRENYSEELHDVRSYTTKYHTETNNTKFASKTKYPQFAHEIKAKIMSNNKSYIFLSKNKARLYTLQIQAK